MPPGEQRSGLLRPGAAAPEVTPARLGIWQQASIDSRNVVTTPGTIDTGGSPGGATGRPPADRFMRRVLRIPERRPAASEDGAHRIFSVSILLSALRCLLTYIFLPIITPLLGAATSVGPAIGIPLALVALVFDVLGIRRFWLADHRWRWSMTGVYAVVMAFVVALLIINLIDIA
jgi:hypothetical protein